MHLHTELSLATVLVATTMGCDDPDADNDDFNEPAEAVETAPQEAVLRAPVSLEYEDPDDFAILNDRSNLRRDELSPLDHRRWLSRRSRDELLAEMQGVVFPTDEEIALVSMRWFVTGTGIVAQNPTTRPFTVSAYFSATTAPACGVAVPMRVVAGGASAILTPQVLSDCMFDRADVSLTDEYGFLVNLIAVEAEERKP
jgi:hypothetical protein